MSLMEHEREEIARVLRFKNLPYNPFRESLYTVKELMEGYSSEHPQRSLDARIAAHFQSTDRKHPNVHEALAERLHDHEIDSALYRFVNPKDSPPRKVIGIMGSHSTARNAGDYATIARTAWLLCQKGFCVVTGGGPGMMEAGNLGAYLAKQPEQAVTRAIDVLAAAPTYPQNEAAYIAAASEVRRQFSDSGLSLAIPTWAYAGEPTGQFSSAIGKYFSNSIREDGLLAIAAWGVVFAPGSAGTLQEIFQDAAHNSYWSFHSRAPMVFFKTSFFCAAPSIFDVLQARAQQDGYGSMVKVLDEPGAIVDFIETHPVMEQPGQGRTFGFTGLELRAK
jgi:predicted Rossmann-fold nucleotide-binding protein